MIHRAAEKKKSTF